MLSEGDIAERVKVIAGVLVTTKLVIAQLSGNSMVTGHNLATGHRLATGHSLATGHMTGTWSHDWQLVTCLSIGHMPSN